MHLSRQLAAFIRAGLPLLEAVHTIGAESENSSVRRMMNEIEDGLRARRQALGLPRPAPEGLPRVLPRHPALGRAHRRARHRARPARQVPRARPRGPAQDQVGADLPDRRRGDVAGHRAWSWPASCCRSSRSSSPSLDAELPLPTRMLLGFTDFLGQLVVGDRSAGSRRWCCSCFGITPRPAGAATPGTRSCSRSRCSARPSSTPWSSGSAGSSSSMVERRREPARGAAGRPPRRCATGSSSGGSAQVARGRCCEGEGLAGPLARTGLFPGTADADAPRRRGHRHARRPARGHRASTTRASSTTRSRS